MGYVSSGEFEEHIREIFGPLKAKKGARKKLVFSRFDSELSVELTALYDLFQTYELPDVGGLKWSHFGSIPEACGVSVDDLSDKHGVDEEDVELFRESIAVFCSRGRDRLYTASDSGVCLAFDHPFEISIWHEDFQTFLSFLVWLSAAATGHTPLSEVQDIFEYEFVSFEGENFLENAIESAQAY